MTNAARQAALTALLTLPLAGTARAVQWPSFGGGPLRQNFNPVETIITASTVAGLHQHWSVELKSATETQPLYIENVATASGVHNEVFVTTLAGEVMGINAQTGAVDWSVTLPMLSVPCKPTPPQGSFGTPTISIAKRILYIVDRAGGLHGLSLGTGAETAPYPVQVIPPTELANFAHNHSSPTLLGNTLYVTTASTPQCEGAFPFHGAVYAVNDVQGTVTAQFIPVNNAGGGGGIWGPGGMVNDPVTGRMFTATGNALTFPTYQPYGEAVLAFSRQLSLLDFNTPGPPILNFKGDYDFGSTPTMIDTPGCPPLLAVVNKTGWLFLYNRSNLAAGPLQMLDMGPGGGGGPYHGMLSYDPVLNILFMDNPRALPGGTFVHGAIAMMATAPGCILQTAWQSPFATDAPATGTTTPTIAGGLVWMPTGAGNSVIAYAEQGGAIAWSSGTALHGGANAPVTVADGQVFIYAGSVLSAWGL